MARLIIISTLLLSLLLLGRWGTITMQQTDPLSELHDPITQPQVRLKPVRPVSPTHFSPSVPAVLPDLNVGYLFNVNRLLVEINQHADGTGQEKIDLRAAFYVGSIITEKARTAIISYPVFRETRQGVQARNGIILKMEQVFLKEGDIIAGYKVLAIHADRIVFKKDLEIFEKTLHDPAKQRLAPAQITPRDRRIQRPSTRAATSQAATPGTNRRPPAVSKR